MKSKRYPSRQQGSVKRLRELGNKGSVMSGDDTATSKIHRKRKRPNKM